MRWEPLVSVGPFKFNTSIHLYLKSYKLKLKHKAKGIPHWDIYETSDGKVRICTENSEIVSISCSQSCEYQTHNIVGLKFSELKALLGSEDRIDDEEAGAIPVLYDSFGLQVWLKNDIVIDVACSGSIED
jgi:hypothetical protein